MIASATSIQLRRSPHRAEDGDDCVFQQSTLFEILNQCREGPVELRAQMTFVIQIRVVKTAAVSVHVPAGQIKNRVEVVDRHVTRTALDQTPSQQTALAECVSAIAITDTVRFFGDLEGIAGFGRGQQIERAGIGTVVKLSRVRLHARLQSIDLSQQTAPLVRATGSESLGRFEIADLEIRTGGIGSQKKRLVRTADEARRLSMQRAGTGVADLARQNNVCWQFALRAKHA